MLKMRSLDMYPGIQVLELAIGIKDLLISAGFTTVDSLLRQSPSDLAAILGIEFYVAKIITDTAKKAAASADEAKAHDINRPSVAPTNQKSPPPSNNL
jgi:hypothetical protein